MGPMTIQAVKGYISSWANKKWNVGFGVQISSAGSCPMKFKE